MTFPRHPGQRVHFVGLAATFGPTRSWPARTTLPADGEDLRRKVVVVSRVLKRLFCCRNYWVPAGFHLFGVPQRTACCEGVLAECGLLEMTPLSPPTLVPLARVPAGHRRSVRCPWRPEEHLPRHRSPGDVLFLAVGSAVWARTVPGFHAPPGRCGPAGGPCSRNR